MLSLSEGRMVRFLRTLISLAIIFILAGCVTTSKTYAPSGEEGYSITCSGALQTWGDCYERAGELCGNKGYEVIDKSDERGALFGGNRYGFAGGTKIYRSILIKCGVDFAHQEQQIPEMQREKPAISFGTGWVVAPGFIVTSNHVVDEVNELYLFSSIGRRIEARVFTRDRVNDIAVLAFDSTHTNALSIPLAASQADPGTKVFTIGYPYPDMMGAEAKITDGIVSSTSGISDDPRVYQISVPLQPGNSGGPLLNMNGEVIGITASKLDAVTTLQRTGTLPENVNYAVKIQYLEPLLKNIPGSIVTEGLHLKSGNTLEELSKRIRDSVFVVVAEEAPESELKSREPDRSSIPQWMRKYQNQQ
jgi:S1-C subfamily serine protease